MPRKWNQLANLATPAANDEVMVRDITEQGDVKAKHSTVQAVVNAGLPATASESDAHNRNSQEVRMWTSQRVHQAVAEFLDEALTGNTESGITVTYQGSDDTVDFQVNASEVATLLNALTGSERLSYNSLRNTPPIPDGATIRAVIHALIETAANGGTQDGITVAYQTSDNTIDFSIDGARVAAILNALTGHARLNYSALQGAPSIPTLPTVVDQATAQAGTSSTAYLWTPLRVAQAIAALAPTGGGGGLTQGQVDTRIRTLRPNALTNALAAKLNRLNVSSLSTPTLDNSGNLSINYNDGGGTSRAVSVDLSSLSNAASWSDTGSVLVPGTGISIALNAAGNYVITATGSSTPGRSHAIYSAIKETSAFTASDFTTPATGNQVSSGNTIATDTWATGNRYLAFAIPASEDDLTSIMIQGDSFMQQFLGTGTAQRPRFSKQPGTLTINGVSHKIYESNIAMLQNAYGGGITWVLT